MEFAVLGPLEVRIGDRVVAPPGRKQRMLLAVLTCHPNTTVRTDELIAALWPTAAAPPSARDNIRLYVTAVRRALGDPARITRNRGGCALAVQPGELDSERFTALVERGVTALGIGEYALASTVLRTALELWRGPAYADLDRVDGVREVVTRLEEQRAAALEARAEADLALGRHVELVGELTEVTSRQPLRERFRAQLMLALYRCGRRAEALDVYRSARRALVTELGLEPGEELRRLQRQILTADPAVEAPGGPRETLPRACAMAATQRPAPRRAGDATATATATAAATADPSAALWI